jgi:integrase
VSVEHDGEAKNIFDIDDLESDCLEAVRHELEYADLPRVAQRKSGLIAKLLHDPTGSFKISSWSCYADTTWLLNEQPLQTKHLVRFNSELVDGNHLKRMIVYHLIPQFDPLGRLKSFSSTTTYAYAFSILEKWVFKRNELDASPSNIKMISSRLLNDALDNVRDNGPARSYFLLYFIVSFWLTLSANELIPPTHRLDVKRNLICTPQRRKEIEDRAIFERRGWRPFSEEELGKLIEYAIFWIEKGTPIILEISEFLSEHSSGVRVKKSFLDSKEWCEFERVLDQKVNGVDVCGFTRIEKKRTVLKSDGRTKSYSIFYYRWVRQFRTAVDMVRDAVLIFTALVMGMRKRELSVLTFDDVKCSANGEWSISITRFKTSTDPAYFGDVDEVPLPSYIADAIQQYKRLRSFDNNMRSGLLFEQIGNSRNTNLADRAIYRAFSNLGNRIGIDEVHPHRFRKTVAEILINRSERNIDLIRLLFGHASYTMTVRYIARNPFLVKSVVEALEVNYTEAFMEIVSALDGGAYSGSAAERIAKATSDIPLVFKGRIFNITVSNYISHLLQAGEQVFIKRVSLGMYCVKDGGGTTGEVLPCLTHTREGTDGIPDVRNCRPTCSNLVVLNEARLMLEQNIRFYSSVLENNSEIISRASARLLNANLSASRNHLENLNIPRAGVGVSRG